MEFQNFIEQNIKKIFLVLNIDTNINGMGFVNKRSFAKQNKGSNQPQQVKKQPLKLRKAEKNLGKAQTNEDKLRKTKNKQKKLKKLRKPYEKN